MEERIVCSSLECYSTAVAKSKMTGDTYCARCAMKVVERFGTEDIETIPGAKFPWEYPADMVCTNCGIKFNMHVTAYTGACPSCNRTIEGLRG